MVTQAVSNSKQMPKVSIVMSFINRRKQLEATLKTIHNSKYKNVEIIITDDASNDNENIDDFVNKYGIILIKVNKNEKTWTNPVVGYNKAIMKSTGEIVIIQNPEVCHVNDVISFTVNNLTEADYISFSCCTSPNFRANEHIYNVIATTGLNKSILNDLNKYRVKNRKRVVPWYNHPTIRPVHYHFCAAIHRKNLNRIRAFSYEYKDGYSYDDVDLVMKISYDLKLNTKIIPPDDIFVIHQYHNSHVVSKMAMDRELRINHDIYDKKFDIRQKIASSCANTIPYLFSCYLDKLPLNLLQYLTIRTFLYYNSHWKINLYISKDELNNIKKLNDYWKTLITLDGITVIPIESIDIKMDNNAPKIMKINALKYHILYANGGIWSNLDILYLNSVENIIFTKNYNYDTIISSINGNYKTDFIMTKPGNVIFEKLKNSFINKIEPDVNKIINELKNNTFLTEDKYLYLPYEHNELDKLYNKKCFENLRNNTLGVFWHDKTVESEKFQNEIDTQLSKNNCTLSTLVNGIMEILKNDNFNMDIKMIKH